MSIQQLSRQKCFGGYQMVYKHFSTETQCEMKFTVYEPGGLEEPADVLYFLPGIAHSGETFSDVVGPQRDASELGLIVVATDSSPRGLNLPGDNKIRNFGEGAGAYLDATEGQWAKHYRMYSYVTKELPGLINANFRTSGRKGIMGHSMGGNGALMIGLRNPDLFQSISATAPIANPSTTNWAAEEAWVHYLGSNVEEWRKYDSTEVAKNYKGPHRHILIDQGTADALDFLKPENFQKAVNENSERLTLELRYQEGYSHLSNSFVKTFIGDHLRHHARILKSSTK